MIPPSPDTVFQTLAIEDGQETAASIAAPADCSPTQYMLLSMLAQKPRSGYELSRLSKPPASFVWTVAQSQLYPDLAALADAGLIQFARSEGRGPLDKKTYWLTPAGQDSLSAFVRGPRPSETHRDTLALWAMSTWTLEPAQATKIWRREAERLRGDAAALRARWATNRVVYGRPALPRPPSRAFGPWAALEMAARRKDGEAAFAAELAERYRALAEPASDAEDNPASGGQARLTPLQRTLLSILAVRPRTGYDFGVLFRPPADLIWSVGLSQIYPELAKLAKSGLVTFKSSPGRGPLDKKTYAIADAGRTALRHDILRPRPPESHRNMLCLWAHGSWILGPAEAARIWEREAAILQADAAALDQRYQELRALIGIPAETTPTAPAFASWAVFQTAIRRRRAEAAFAAELAAAYRAAIQHTP